MCVKHIILQILYGWTVPLLTLVGIRPWGHDAQSVDENSLMRRMYGRERTLIRSLSDVRTSGIGQEKGIRASCAKSIGKKGGESVMF